MAAKTVRRIVGIALLGVVAAMGFYAARHFSFTRAADALPPSALTSPAINKERILADIVTLVDAGPRRSGSPGIARAAAFVRQSLSDAGAQMLWEDKSFTHAWTVTAASVDMGGKRIDAFPSEQSFLGQPDINWTGTFSTGADGRTAPILDLGDASLAELQKADVRGKIVLFNLRFEIPGYELLLGSNYAYDPDRSFLRDPKHLLQTNPYLTNYERVIGHLSGKGAAGFIGVLTDYFDSNRYRNELYRRALADMPGFWVTKDEGARMRALLAGGQTQATLHMEGERKLVPARSVFAFLPGQNPEEVVLVQSHLDSLGPGAVEDASGTASVLALARHYGALPLSKRPRSLMFALFDSHYTGYQSHQAFIRDTITHPRGPYRIVANVTVEHIAKQGRIVEGKLVLDDLPEPRGIFYTGGPKMDALLRQTVRRYDLDRTVILDASALFGKNPNLPTDASFLSEAGVPLASYIAGPVYLYDDVDTVDTIAQDELAPVTFAMAHIIDQFMAMPEQDFR